MAKTTNTTEFRLHEVLFKVVRPERVLRTAETSEAVARVAHDLLPDDGREHFAALLVDGRLRVLGWHLVAVGGLDGVKVSAREVFGAALCVLGTDAVILVHNHPSGAAQISREDRALTRALVKAGKIVGIEVLDHLVVAHGSGKWQSILYPQKRGVVACPICRQPGGWHAAAPHVHMPKARQRELWKRTEVLDNRILAKPSRRPRRSTRKQS